MSYSSVEDVDISSSGTVAAQLALPPLRHDSLQMLSDGAAIQMTIVLPPSDVERFARALRARTREMVRRYHIYWAEPFGFDIVQTCQIKLDGVLIRKAAERISVNRSPTRLEFDLSAKGSASYQVQWSTSCVDRLMQCTSSIEQSKGHRGRRFVQLLLSSYHDLTSLFIPRFILYRGNYHSTSISSERSWR